MPLNFHTGKRGVLVHIHHKTAGNKNGQLPKTCCYIIKMSFVITVGIEHFDNSGIEYSDEYYDVLGIERE